MTVADRYGPKTKVMRVDPHAYSILIKNKGRTETISDVIRRLAKAGPS